MLVSFLACFVSLAQVQAQGINLDSVSSADTGGAASNSLTFSHTVGAAGTNRLLVVGVSICTTGFNNYTVTSVTYGGNALTSVGGISGFWFESLFPLRLGFVRSETWALAGPATGPNNVVVTLSGTTNFVAGAISFTGASQTIPPGTFFSATGTSTTPSVNVTTVNEGDVVIDTVARQQCKPRNLARIRSNPALEQGHKCGELRSDVIGGDSTEPGPDGGGTVTMNWSSTSSLGWSIGAVAIKPANPTAVKLVSFAAAKHGAASLLKWKTGFEVNNLGFHVYREENGELVRLTPDLIAGSALLAGSGTSLGAGRSYHWWDISSVSPQSSGVGTVRYWLEDTDLSGKTDVAWSRCATS